MFGVKLRWLPVSGSATLAALRPARRSRSATTPRPAFMRLTRAGMLEVLASDYIRTARAKGLRTMNVLFKHALRNAIIPVVAVAAVQFGFMLGGSIVIESGVLAARHRLSRLGGDQPRRLSGGAGDRADSRLHLHRLTLLADMLNACARSAHPGALRSPR